MIQAIKKTYPILDEKGRPCTFPTFGSQVFGEGENTRALWQSDKGFYADDSEKLGGKLSSEYLSMNDTAADSEKLGGRAASEYALASSIDTLTSPFFIGQNTVKVEAGFDQNPTSSSSKVFTAPENGMFYLFADRGSTSGNTIRVHVLNPDGSANCIFPFPAYAAYATAAATIPIAKGMKLKLDTDATSSTWTIRSQVFYYNN